MTRAGARPGDITIETCVRPVQAETAAVRWRGLVGDLVHGGEFAEWMKTRDPEQYTFAADREYQEARDAYAAHIANPTEDRGFVALVSERDAAIAEAREAKAALAEATERAEIQAQQRAEDAAAMARQAGTVIAQRAALEEAIAIIEALQMFLADKIAALKAKVP